MEEKLRKIWSISLMVINIAALTMNVCDPASVELPVIVKAVCAAVFAVGVPAAAYTTVRLFKLRKARKD
ncbi:hypothetical protein [Ruminococcus sp.]|uniref:hypothetical protein n=1 Tax=Ruminococcus sp. TaxID=41978 RepID=UPI0025E14F44|nr:hypothetical protein [Ruminococcus sp.]MBQ9541917.1 hypothetical protein [Ruminococcus sp.]